MLSNFPLFPVEASTVAEHVDSLYFFLVAVSGFFAILIAVLVVTFAIRYRRRSEDELPKPIHGSLRLEMTWTLIPFAIAMIMFFWGASVYLEISRPPDDALEVFVVGKQWMWKLQHLEGRREINELHVPIGQPIKLTMTSEDVIHSFFVPAFRIKADVVPGRYTTTWFQATKAGRYHLFCAEYCGTEHSGMIGWIDVMEQADYQAWLGAPQTGETGPPVASAGEGLFQKYGCVTCHRAGGSGGLGPALVGLYGSTVRLRNGRTLIADDAYIRESILNPRAQVVAGYKPVMPTFQGQISEEGVLQLIQYIKSLSSRAGGENARPAAAPPAQDS
jgi:cytochrome c oxidase subunit 2